MLNESAHFLSAITHFAGAGIFMLYGLGLINSSRMHHRVGVSIFVASTVFLLLMSGLYHILPDGPSKKIFRVLDHVAIFLLMGGTYTVCYALFVDSQAVRRKLLAAVWIVTFCLILAKSWFFFQMGETVSFALYMGAGWMGILMGYYILKVKGFNHLIDLLAGGLLYSIGGAMDYANYNVGPVNAHVAFHIFVLLALLVHFNYVKRHLVLFGQGFDRAKAMANVVVQAATLQTLPGSEAAQKPNHGDSKNDASASPVKNKRD